MVRSRRVALPRVSPAPSQDAMSSVPSRSRKIGFYGRNAPSHPWVRLHRSASCARNHGGKPQCCPELRDLMKVSRSLDRLPLAPGARVARALASSKSAVLLLDDPGRKWSGWPDVRRRSLRPKRSALAPTLQPEILRAGVSAVGFLRCYRAPPTR